jgi:hypothetical protein
MGVYMGSSVRSGCDATRGEDNSLLLLRHHRYVHTALMGEAPGQSHCASRAWGVLSRIGSSSESSEVLVAKL